MEALEKALEGLLETARALGFYPVEEPNYLRLLKERLAILLNDAHRLDLPQRAHLPFLVYAAKLYDHEKEKANLEYALENASKESRPKSVMIQNTKVEFGASDYDLAKSKRDVMHLNGLKEAESDYKKLLCSIRKLRRRP